VKKWVYCFVFLCIFSSLAFAQNLAKLVGAHSNGTVNVFSSVDLAGGTYNQISTLAGTSSFSSSETTFDEANFRYFVKAGSGILIINALNGAVLDSITNTASFYNIEYDKLSNSIVGMNWVGKVVNFKVYDLTTKTWSTKSTLTAMDSLVVGESTYDPIRRKYFTMCNLGMAVVDSNGVLSDVLCASPNLNGIEYDPNSNKVYYLEWGGNSYFFVGIDATSCSIGVLGTFTAVTTVAKGESTFDKTQGRYFCKTNLGLIEVGVQNGNLLQSLTATNNFGGSEFYDASTIGITEQRDEHGSVSPNPSRDVFYFSKVKRGARLEVFNVSGQCIFSSIVNETSFQLDLKVSTGIYFYRIYSAEERVKQGRLVLE
jgi:hypothetical protein